MTIFSKWQRYEREVVLARAGIVQREECRRAFYAGCAAMHGLIFAATDDDDPEERLAALDVELKDIAKDLRL